MKFLIAVIDDKSNSGTSDEMAHIDAFNEMLRERGHWFFAGGLYEPESAYVMDNRADANVISEGSHFVSAEHYSGLWIIEADSMQTAKELAVQASKACNRKVEVRSFHG